MRIPAEGGTPEFTGVAMSRLWSFDLSPDGSRIAYGTTPGVESSELMAIDNLPTLVAGAK
jgi:hypothetical protein